MLSQALNRAMPQSRNQLEGVNRKELTFYLTVQLYCTAEMDAGHFFWTQPDPTHTNSDPTRPGPVILRCSEVQKL